MKKESIRVVSKEASDPKHFIVRRPRARQWAVFAGLTTATVASSACSAPSAGDPAESSASAIHGVVAIDTTLPAVVRVFNNTDSGSCSGTLIGDQTILTAAHCFHREAQGCEDLTTAAQNTVVQVSLDGVNAVATYYADSVAIHPQAYAHLNNCPAGSVNVPPAINACNSPKADETTGLQQEHDLAIIHVVSVTGDLPSKHAAPMRVLTSITDNNTGAYGYHQQLNTSTDFGRSAQTLGYIVGWGNDDFNALPDGGTVPVERHLGVMVFEYGPAFDQGCDTFFSCYGSASNASTCTLAGNPRAGTYANQFPVTFIEMQRTVALTGPYPDHGDSGGPLLLHAGTSHGDVADLPTTTVGPSGYAVLGVLSKGYGPASCVATGDGNPPGPGDCRVTYPPTYSQGASGNGPWIEATLQRLAYDTDGDGVPNANDNCPSVPNPDQADTNLLAEQTMSSAVLGDACDPTPTTEGLSQIDFQSRVGSASCINFIRSGDHVTGYRGGSCPETVSSGLVMNSFIGAPNGDQYANFGQTGASFCKCPFANTASASQCYVAPFSCTAARDTLYPYTSPTLSSWKKLTAYSATLKAYVAFPPALTLFQDPTAIAAQLLNYNPNDPHANVVTEWDFLNDLGQFGAVGATSLTGVLWNHVVQQNTVSPLPVNLANHYLETTVSAQPGLGSTTVIPVGINRWNPWKQWYGENRGEGISWALVAKQASGPPIVFAQRAGTTHVISSQFTSDALTAMTGLADGTSQLLVRSDLMGEHIHKNLFGNPSAVVLAAGTLQLTSDLYQSESGGTIGTVSGGGHSNVARTPRTSQMHALTAQPAIQTLALANDGWIYALEGTRGNAQLCQQGDDDPDPTDVICASLSGAALNNPVAMVWDTFDSGLYIADVAAQSGDPVLRLLRIGAHSTVVTELWHLDSVATSPANVGLTMTFEDELVLTLGIKANDPNLSTGGVEVLLFDRQGRPLGSTSYEDTNLSWMGPAVGNMNGITIGYNDLAPNAPANTRLNLKMVPRSSLGLKDCNALWFSSHAPAADPILGIQADCSYGH